MRNIKTTRGVRKEDRIKIKDKESQEENTNKNKRELVFSLDYTV